VICLVIPGTATRTAYDIPPPALKVHIPVDPARPPLANNHPLFTAISVVRPFLVPSSMPSFHGWDSSHPCASPLWGNPKYFLNPRKHSFPPIVTERNLHRPSQNPTQNESARWGGGGFVRCSCDILNGDIHESNIMYCPVQKKGMRRNP
jgi:hypothetical protein